MTNKKEEINLNRFESEKNPLKSSSLTFYKAQVFKFYPVIPKRLGVELEWKGKQNDKQRRGGEKQSKKGLVVTHKSKFA